MGGRKELNTFRAKVIKEHTAVISAFVDTSESKFGQIALKRMFEAADKDGNGTLDPDEVKAALNALGFTFIDKNEVDKISRRRTRTKTTSSTSRSSARRRPRRCEPPSSSLPSRTGTTSASSRKAADGRRMHGLSC